MPERRSCSPARHRFKSACSMQAIRNTTSARSAHQNQFPTLQASCLKQGHSGCILQRLNSGLLCTLRFAPMLQVHLTLLSKEPLVHITFSNFFRGTQVRNTSWQVTARKRGCWSQGGQDNIPCGVRPPQRTRVLPLPSTLSFPIAC